MADHCGDGRSAVDNVGGEFGNIDRRGGTEESWGIVAGWDLEGAGIMMICRIRNLGKLVLGIVGQVVGCLGLDRRVRIAV